jgi:signal transduction histidine kinase
MKSEPAARVTDPDGPVETHALAPGQNDEIARYLKTELLDRVAHELRGPAGVTLGALDEIERILSQYDNDEARTLISMARRGAKRVLRTAERLTRTAQLEHSALPLAKVSLDVRDLVSRTARDAEQLEGRGGIKVELVLSTLPCVAHVDSSWLGAALSEMFSQAIRCARARVQIEVQSEGGVVRISTHDDRTSSMEVPVRRFLPIRDRRDCALGWPIAHEIALAHGGELTVEHVSDKATGRISGAIAVLSLRAG